MRVSRWGLLVFLLLLFLLIAPVAAQPDDGLTVGFLEIATESEWHTAYVESIKQEAAQRGIELLIYDTCCVHSSFINLFSSFVEQRVDVILFEPPVTDGWDEALQEAADADIPVVILERPINTDESLYVTRVGLDFVHQGRLAGAWLAQATSGSCAIVEIEGTAGSWATLDRQTGFNDVIALFPQMTIIAAETGDFMRANGHMAMETILATIDPADICAVWAHNDDMALGAIDALKAAGVDPGEDVLIVSIDAISDMREAIAAGDANATVELSPNLGQPVFDALAAYFAGESLPKWIPIRDGDVITQQTNGPG